MLSGIEDVHPFYQLVISLILGLLVGLQRQWADSPQGGIRTFSLITLLGTVCALLADKYGGWIIGVGFAGTIAAMVSGDIAKKEQISPRQHSGLVTEFSMLLMFADGVLVHLGPAWLAAAVAGSLAVILQAKLELHGIVSRFSAKEIRAIMQFVLISLVILPLVPDRTFGPFGVLNPHDIWLMVVLIVAISLLGYILYKFHGEKAGVLLGGILGGTISSTAATLAYAKRAAGGAKNIPHCALIILIAWTTLYCRVALESAIVAPQFHQVWAPLGVLFSVSALSTLWSWRHAHNHQKGMPEQSNPTELPMALAFGLLYSAVIFAVAAAKHYFGASGLGLVAVLSGLTEVDAITLSTARLVSGGGLAPEEGWHVIVAAVLSNTFFKGGLALFFGGKGLFRRILFPAAATLIAGILLLAAG